MPTILSPCCMNTALQPRISEQVDGYPIARCDKSGKLAFTSPHLRQLGNNFVGIIIVCIQSSALPNGSAYLGTQPPIRPDRHIQGSATTYVAALTGQGKRDMYLARRGRRIKTKQALTVDRAGMQSQADNAIRAKQAVHIIRHAKSTRSHYFIAEISLLKRVLRLMLLSSIRGSFPCKSKT